MSTIKTVSVKLIASAVGAGLALSGVAAIQAPAPAQAASTIVSARSAAATCKTAKATYTKAKKANAKAVKKATAAVKKAKKARAKNKKTGTKYTVAKSHKKLLKAVTKQVAASKKKTLKVSTACGSYAKAAKITKVTKKVKANTAAVTKATSKLTKNVNTFLGKKSVKRYDGQRIGPVITKVTKSGYVLKTWKEWQKVCRSTWRLVNNKPERYKTTCAWEIIWHSNDKIVYECFSPNDIRTTYRASRGWTRETAKIDSKKYCK